MTPQEATRRARREAEVMEKFARLDPEQRRIVTAVVERMAVGSESFEDALENVTGVRDIAHLAVWTA